MVALEKRSTTTIVWGCSSVVERSIRIRDARGSIPLISISFFDPWWRPLVAEAQKKGLTAVGFEPTPRKTGASTSALDHSATLPYHFLIKRKKTAPGLLLLRY